MPAAADLRHARTLWDYLRLGDPIRPAECLLVLGGHDIGVATRAAGLYQDGTVPFIVVSGGSRAVPDGSDFPTEADAIADVLLDRGVPKDAIALERLASNTSENFWLSAELLRDLGMDPQSFLAVNKPYAERRTLATARRRWPDKSVAITSEQVSFDDYLTGGIQADRILSMLAGEALRLEAYAATGLINPGEPVPGHILDAARILQEAGYNSRAVRSALHTSCARTARGDRSITTRAGSLLVVVMAQPRLCRRRSNSPGSYWSWKVCRLSPSIR